jgi:branched-subunit amino acid aminotransferase/4-amino-4-deoxychorismate lyase
MTQFWCNGEWLAELPASPMDRGHLHGLALFETLLAIHGVPRFADRHLIRLAKGCEKLGWSMPHAHLSTIMEELLLRNGLEKGRARIRLTMTAGSGPLDDLAPGAGHLLWMAAFPAPEPPLSLAVTHSPWPRNENSPLAGLKCASYAENLIALDHARRLGFDEVVFTNTAGILCEAATANIFIVKNGQILTPSLDSGCLPGITREILLEEQECLETALTYLDLLAADEIFLTSSTRGPLPVTRVGEMAFQVGPVMKELREGWLAAHHQP